MSHIAFHFIDYSTDIFHIIKFPVMTMNRILTFRTQHFSSVKPLRLVHKFRNIWHHNSILMHEWLCSNHD